MTGRQLRQPSQKLRVYETLHSLNEAFEQVLTDFRRLQEFPFFRRQLLRALSVVVEETRAWANYELIETMHQREQADWAKFGRLRNRWEQRYKDSSDALFEAEGLKRKMRKAAGKHRLKGGRGARHD